MKLSIAQCHLLNRTLPNGVLPCNGLAQHTVARALARRGLVTRCIDGAWRLTPKGREWLYGDLIFLR